MSDAIDEVTVRHVARLARLRLEDDEVARARAELASVLLHVQELASVDVEGVVPSFHGTGTERLRADEPTVGLDRDTALAAAPEARDEGFAVPQVIE